ncbi:MAG: VWA domain-containing protein [Puniceicoccales bacterium]|jgi:Ca-activated chloride channel family protein|nr:VWA domain-containing protein [Puniceicoccales bacterium]
MSIGNYIFLFLLPIWGLFVLLFLIWGRRRKYRLLRKFTAERLFPVVLQNYSPAREKFKHMLFLAAILFIGFSLAAPRWGYKEEERYTQGVDLLVAVDVSKSMLADDIKPNRLERTKLAILDLLQKFSGHRVGLIAFAGTSFLQCPLTLDYNAFTQSLNALDTDLIPVPGTAIHSALELAEKVYSRAHNQRLLLLFSDGEELAESAIGGAKQAKDAEIFVFTIGIGSPEGSTIPVVSAKTGFPEELRDRKGQVVRTMLDEETLQKVAEITDGQYYRLSPRALEQLKRDILEKFPILKEKSAENSYIEKIPQERYQVFLLLGFLLLILEMLIHTARKQTRYSVSIYYQLSALAILLLLSFSQLSARDSRGEALYKEGKFGEALEFYDETLAKNPNNNAILYNKGTTLLTMRDYEGAEKSFKQALPDAPVELQKNVFYNLGHTFFQKGMGLTDPQGKLQQWEDSKKNFQSAIDLDPQFNDAKQNLQYVEEEIRKLKDQQERQNQQKSDQNKDEDKEQNFDQNQSNPSDKQQENSERKDKETSEEQPFPNMQEDYTSQPQERTPDGQMTRAEALQLLNSLENNEKKLPFKRLPVSIRPGNPEKFW